MIKTKKEMYRFLRKWLSGELEIREYEDKDTKCLFVNYEKTFLLEGVLNLLKNLKIIQNYRHYYSGWYEVDIIDKKIDKTKYQYANYTLTYSGLISYNEIVENISYNKYLHDNITKTTNATSMCVTNNNKIIITFSIYGYFNFDKDGKCIDYDVINVDDDLYVFNSYDEFKQENLEIINILTNKQTKEK